MLTDLALVYSKHQRVEYRRRQVVVVHLVALVWGLGLEEEAGVTRGDALVEEGTRLEGVLFVCQRGLVVRGRRPWTQVAMVSVQNRRCF